MIDERGRRKGVERGKERETEMPVSQKWTLTVEKIVDIDHHIKLQVYVTNR